MFDPDTLRDAIEARLQKLCLKSIAPVVGNLGFSFNAHLSKDEALASNKAADAIVAAIWGNFRNQDDLADGHQTTQADGSKNTL